MKRGEERGDRSVAVPYCLGCQFNQLIRIDFLARGWPSLNGGQPLWFSPSGSGEGGRVLIHPAFMGSFGAKLQVKILDA